ncbi:MAG: ADP-heptose:LPS heptosyltransferase [Myxococcota bacterium]
MLLIRAPDHLGDGVMALPAISALAETQPCIIAAPRWGEALYSGLGTIVRSDAAPRADAAVLLKPSLGAAWAVRHIPRRIGLSTDARWFLLTDAVVPTQRHRVDDFAAVARAAGAQVAGLPSYAPTGCAPTVSPDAVLLLPGTASPHTARWKHYRDLADALDGQAIFTGGPGDEEAIAEIAGPHPILPILSLPDFAALSAAVRAVVGNDSGLSHLAAAARRGHGVNPADVHVVFGSTDPVRTGAPGATWHLGESPQCWPCYAKRCPWDAPCLEHPAQNVLERL